MTFFKKVVLGLIQALMTTLKGNFIACFLGFFSGEAFLINFFDCAIKPGMQILLNFWCLVTNRQPTSKSRCEVSTQYRASELD